MGIGSLLLMCSYAGLVIFAFYDVQGCDPINAKLVEKADQLFPLFVMQVMGDVTCIPGLFVAGKEHFFLCFRTQTFLVLLWLCLGNLLKPFLSSSWLPLISLRVNI